MEKLKMKVEPCSDEEQDTLGKLVKNEEETLTVTCSNEQFCEHAYRPIYLQMHSTTSESEFLEERPSCVIFNSSVTKDKQEENCNRLPKKTEKTLVREKTEPDALPQDGIISKFSDSDDDNDINSLKYIVRNMKKENEYQKDLKQIDPALENTSDVNTYMKSCDGNHFHGCHGLIQEDSHSEIRKSHLLKTSNIFRKNLKQYVIPYTEEKPYSCGICGKEFVRSFNLKIHQRIHTGEKPYSCVACGKEFITNSNMKMHNVIHTGEKPYRCVVCGKYFGSRSYIKMHERIHSGEKPYTCILCGKQFGRSSQLTTHERIHTGEKPYSCVLCGKQFGRSGQLRRHQRIHTGEKPYSCETCGKEFGINCNLKTHKKLHTGEKPYSYEICGKEFVTNGNLKIHKISHTGEKPYSCVVCGKDFVSKCYLKKHESIHIM